MINDLRDITYKIIPFLFFVIVVFSTGAVLAATIYVKVLPPRGTIVIASLLLSLFILFFCGFSYLYTRRKRMGDIELEQRLSRSARNQAERGQQLVDRHDSNTQQGQQIDPNQTDQLNEQAPSPRTYNRNRSAIWGTRESPRTPIEIGATTEANVERIVPQPTPIRDYRRPAVHALSQTPVPITRSWNTRQHRLQSRVEAHQRDNFQPGPNPPLRDRTTSQPNSNLHPNANASPEPLHPTAPSHLRAPYREYRYVPNPIHAALGELDTPAPPPQVHHRIPRENNSLTNVPSQLIPGNTQFDPSTRTPMMDPHRRVGATNPYDTPITPILNPTESRSNPDDRGALPSRHNPQQNTSHVLSPTQIHELSTHGHQRRPAPSTAQHPMPYQTTQPTTIPSTSHAPPIPSNSLTNPHPPDPELTPAPLRTPGRPSHRTNRPQGPRPPPTTTIPSRSSSRSRDRFAPNPYVSKGAQTQSPCDT
ncbi:hypothetical protein GGR57DRAFT_461440 [Xylariaceae sp. FL1272]|nr:hypothetical protein GGR57DRAFT_461440 [Xylariaceae sp. FL1272]